MRTYAHIIMAIVESEPSLRRSMTHQRREETRKKAQTSCSSERKSSKTDNDGAKSTKTQSSLTESPEQLRKTSSTSRRIKSAVVSSRTTRSASSSRPNSAEAGADYKSAATSSRASSRVVGTHQKDVGPPSANRGMVLSRKNGKPLTARKAKNDDTPRMDTKSKYSEKLTTESARQSSGKRSLKKTKPPPHHSVVKISISDVAKPVVGSANSFASRIYHMICSKQSARTVVIAPHAIHTCVSMLMFGARGDANVMLSNALGLPENHDTMSDGFTELVRYYHKKEEESDIIFHHVNGLFIDAKFGVMEGFRDILRNVYRITPGEVDFENDMANSINKINKCVSSLTNNQVNDILVDYASLHATMALTSALCLSAAWSSPFSKSRTKRELFATTKHKCSMMHLRHHFVHYPVESLGAEVVELPFAGNFISMLLLLPLQEDGFDAMEGQMSTTSPGLESILTQSAAMRGRSKLVDVSLPRFTIKSSHDMMSPLHSLGLGSILVGVTTLSGLSENSVGLRPDIVMQKVVLRIDESGANPTKKQRADAPDDKDEHGSYAGYVKQFNCNRPFVFVIKDARTGYMIFFGRVLDPSE